MFHGGFRQLWLRRLFRGGDAPCLSVLGDRDMGSILLGFGDFDPFLCRYISFWSLFGYLSKFSQLVWQQGWRRQRVVAILLSGLPYYQ